MSRSAGSRARKSAAVIGAVALCSAVPTMTASQAAGPDDRSVSSESSSATPSVREGVRGRVTSASGKPVSEVFVQARSLDRPAPAIPDIAIMTDQAGNYSWPLASGRYEFSFIHQGRTLATRQVTVGRNRVTSLNVQFP